MRLANTYINQRHEILETAKVEHQPNRTTHLEPSRTLEATVATVIGWSSSPILTVQALSGFPPLFVLLSTDNTMPTLYCDVSAMIVRVNVEGHSTKCQAIKRNKKRVAV